jgi:hypothetical protein
MKKIVYTLAWGGTHTKAFALWRFEESVERYCEKIGAERVVDVPEPNGIHPWYRRYQRMEELFSQDDCEVLHLDADIYVTKRAPWFNLKPHKWVGLTRAAEGTFARRAVKATSRFYDKPSEARWHSEARWYFNGGVHFWRFPEAGRFIRDYLELMEKHDFEHQDKHEKGFSKGWCGGDQGALAFIARKWKTKAQIFPRGFNRIHGRCFQNYEKNPLTKHHRFRKDTFFIHMAGRSAKNLIKLYKKFALPISLDM